MVPKNAYTEDLPNEIWVDVYGFDGYYETSNKGRLRSIGREVPTKGGFRWVKGKILSTPPSTKNVRMGAMSVDGIAKKMPMSQIVYYSFHNGPPPNGNVVAHKNKNIADDRLENLEALSLSQSNTLNYMMGNNWERGIGERTKLRAAQLDKELNRTSTYQTCAGCMRDIPVSGFQRRKNDRIERVCIECRKKRAGIVDIDKIKNAKELLHSGLRKCCKCGSIEPVENFYPKKRLLGGVDTMCKVCARAQGRIYDADRRSRKRTARMT